MQRSNEPDAFFTFEREGWNSTIDGYERVLGPVTAQTVEQTLDAACVTSGCRMLDVCTGHGVLAAAAVRRGSEVSALDVGEEVVALARRNVPNAEIRLGDAQNLPYQNDTFHAVVCGYGIIHVPDPGRALSEMRRVLRSGGRVAVSAWESPTEANGFGLLFGAIRTHGRLDVLLPHGPDFFQFGDKPNMQAALADLEFCDVETASIDQAWEFERPGDLIEAVMQGTVRLKALINAQDRNALAAITAHLEQGMLRRFQTSAGYRVPMPAIVGSGTKP